MQKFAGKLNVLTQQSAVVDATLKGNLPPVALPKPEYMEHAKDLWERIGLPQLKPEAPWHGYSLGDWNEGWDQAALRAGEGNYLENGRRTAQCRRTDVKPNTSVMKLSICMAVLERKT